MGAYYSFNRFPYTNLHNLNLDWLLQTVANLERRVDSATPATMRGQYTNIYDLIDNPQDGDITADVTDAINAGKSLYFPAGTYHFHLGNISAPVHMIGDGPDTVIGASGSSVFWRASGRVEGCYIARMRIINKASGYGRQEWLHVDEGAAFVNNTFEGLTIENFLRGINAQFADFLWNDFNDCSFIGNQVAGVVLTGMTGKAVNNNTFVSCKFNYNAGIGLAVYATDNAGALANVFVGCNFEGNGMHYDAFGDTPVPEAAVVLGGVNTLVACYLEANNVQDAVMYINGGHCAMLGCTFTLESAALFHGDANGVVNGYALRGQQNQPSARLTKLGSYTDFTVNMSDCNIGVEGGAELVTPYLDFTRGDHITWTGEFGTVVAPGYMSKPVVVKAQTTATIDASISGTGEAMQVIGGQYYIYMLRDGKLHPVR